MLILILIDVQYSQKAVFSLGKGSNRQDHSSSGSLPPAKKIPPPSKISIPPLPISSKYFTSMMEFFLQK